MKLLITTFVFLLSLAVGKSQYVTTGDLKGEWQYEINRGRNSIYLNFINDSVYLYQSGSDTTKRSDFYNVFTSNGRSFIRMYQMSGTCLVSGATYRIRKTDSVSFQMQLSELFTSGKPDSTTWRDDDKRKTFYMYRMERHTAIPGVVGQRKSAQELLGYPKDAKLLIIHADDLGVSHSENAASISAIENGCVNSASIMVPCPWFSEVAAYSRLYPENDFGLHITLTSEWKYYKWGPVTAVQEVPGLVNKNGFFYSSVDSLVQNASAAEVEAEIRNQVKRAMQFGINPTHLDAHMYAAHHNLAFLKAYLKVGHEFNLPVFINCQIETSLHIKLDTVVSENSGKIML